MIALCLVFAGSFAAAATNEVTEPFEGVRLIHSKSMTPRQVDMWIVEIDMSAPGVSFLVTTSNGDLIGDTTPETTRAFVTREGAQIGINGSFFAMAAKGAASKGQYDVLGLSASKGDAYSPFQKGCVDAINISKDNVATIIRGTGKPMKVASAKPRPQNVGDKKEKESEPDIGFAHTPDVELYNALSGKTRLVKDGTNVAGNDPAIHPRTGIGIKADGKLLLFTVDGREPGHSLGMKFCEMADAMISFGARDAISLDGGGSTTLVMDDPTTPANDPKVLNLPCDPLPNTKEHGKERPTGNNLAVFARRREH
jgi:exopolysaccharide biosynthesis protein